MQCRSAAEPLYCSAGHVSQLLCECLVHCRLCFAFALVLAFVPFACAFAFGFAYQQLFFDCSRAAGSSVCLDAGVEVMLLPKQWALLDPGQVALTEVWLDD